MTIVITRERREASLKWKVHVGGQMNNGTKKKREEGITNLRRVQQSGCWLALNKFPYTFNTNGEQSQAPALLITLQIYRAKKKNVDT